MELIDKATVKAIIGRMQDCTMDEDGNFYSSSALAEYNILCDLENRLDTLEVKDPYEQCIQYDSIKAGIQAHAETYSFNIESELFNQLTKEQQKLWRKEIEQACISGGNAGVELARDPRYKENLEVKEVKEPTASDAFIEKACEWLKSKGGFTIGFDGATVRDFLEFINK